MTKSNVGRKELSLLHRLQLITEGSQSRTSSRTGGRTGGRGWRGKLFADLFLMTYSDCFQMHPGPLPHECVTIYNRLSLHLSIISQENLPQACPQANLSGTFSQLRFIVQNDCSLCQVDKINNQSTKPKNKTKLDRTPISSIHGCSQKILN